MGKRKSVEEKSRENPIRVQDVSKSSKSQSSALTAKRSGGIEVFRIASNRTRSRRDVDDGPEQRLE